MEEQITYHQILNEENIPAIAIDQEGLIFSVNHCFEQEYGWPEHELVGKPVTKIIPPYMRDTHNLGFSRFLTTKTGRILDKEIELPVYRQDGTIDEAKHYITANKQDGKWYFAALIKPL